MEIETAAVAAINERGEMLLAVRAAATDGRLSWAIPQAPVEGSDAAGVARQCLQNVAALHASSWALLGDASTGDNQFIRVFLARDLRTLPDISVPEERQWVPLDKLITMANQGLIHDPATVFVTHTVINSSAPDSVSTPAGDPHSLYDRQEQLARRIEELHALLAQVVERNRRDLDRIDSRLVLLHGRTGEALRQTQSILQSRIWQSLVSGAGILVKLQSLLRRERPAAPRAEVTADDDTVHLQCDEPVSSDDTPRTGRIRIRGWALSRAGIDRVEIQAGNLEPMKARYGLYRTDTPKLFPGIEDASLSEYQLSLDSLFLSNGRHTIRIQAFSKCGRTAEQTVSILIDHIRGHTNDYERWIREFDERDALLIRLKLPVLPRKPPVSILTPVYKTSLVLLERAIASVKNQSYPHWELILVDDGSQSAEITALLERESRLDSRIRCRTLPVNQGIAAASNAALTMAQGEFVALLDHDDELAEDALFHVVDAINNHPDADILYSDEDHIDESGNRCDPFFKPDWSPDLILAENYVCHLMVFRRALAETAGGFGTQVDTAQDHDLLLRMSLHSKQIVHIPKILYHWRTHVDATVSNRASFQEATAFDASKKAVANYLKLASIDARVEQGRWPGRWRIRYAIPPGNEVFILIPTGGKMKLLQQCLNSVIEKTDYPHYRIGIVDNSKSDAVQKFLFDWSKTRRRTVTYLDWRSRRFDFSAMNNALARKVIADARPAPSNGRRLLLFLNDDTEVITPDWLSSMVELASRPEVGAVGAKLLYPDNRIQHAGVVLGLMEICGHGLRGYSTEERVYYDFPDLVRNVSAVTGACLMTPADLFFELGGFDEASLPVAYQDIDLCLKIHSKGLRVLYNPYAVLRHYEAVSKAMEDMNPRANETLALKTRWGHLLESDPFYNPNLTRTSEDYTYRTLEMAV